MVSIQEIEEYGRNVDKLINHINWRIKTSGKIMRDVGEISSFTYMKYYRKNGKWCDESISREV